jgi:hypothetical protein
MNNEHEKSAYSSRFFPSAEIEPFSSFSRYVYLFALNRSCYVVYMTVSEHFVMGLHDFDGRWHPT